MALLGCSVAARTDRLSIEGVRVSESDSTGDIDIEINQPDTPPLVMGDQRRVPVRSGRSTAAG